MGANVKSIAVIIPVVGQWRKQNLEMALLFLRRQSFKDIEIILIEQTDCKIDGQRSERKFFSNAPVDKYMAVINTTNHEFNQPWLANVGAQMADAKKLLFFDSDLIVRKHYLKNVNEFNEPFFYAWNKCLHNSQKISNKMYKMKKLLNDPNAEEQVAGVKAHEGYSVCADSDFFFKQLGCYNENLFGWGGNDNEISVRVRHVLGRGIKPLPVPIYHLWHPRGYAKSTNRKFVTAARRDPE
ncbi:hypothetical protein LCGC14_2948880, partial [marine sediment metagenome]